MEKTTVYLPAELRREIKDLARRTGRPEAAIVREALSSYVAQQDQPVLLSLGAGENPDVHGADTEAWLEAHWRPD